MTHLQGAPVGYEARVGGEINVSEMTELIVTAETAIDGSSPVTESFVGMILDTPGADTEGILTLREAGSGTLVGAALHQDPGPHIESVTNGWVHPDHMGLGIGSGIVEWGLARARSRLELAPAGVRVTNRCQASDADTAAAEVFESFGYHTDRREIQMELVLDGRTPETPLPQGVAVRTMSGADDLPIVARVLAEAFRDHYGWTESSWEQTLRRWENFRAMDEWDDALVYVAETGGDAVGALVGIRSHGANTDTGFIGSLGVVRSWRGRGLARALLTRAFDEYRHRGMRAVALDVDAESLTGATRLYRGVGMEPVRSETAYLIELRPGVDVVTR